MGVDSIVALVLIIKLRPYTVQVLEMLCCAARSSAVLCCAVLFCHAVNSMQFALRKLRGEHDAFNVCVAGTLSAGFLGATCESGLARNAVGNAAGGCHCHCHSRIEVARPVFSACGVRDVPHHTSHAKLHTAHYTASFSPEPEPPTRLVDTTL
jgi:hypothetical protein